MKKINKYLMTALAIVFFLSCQKSIDVENQPTSSASNYSVVDGRLNFKTKADFDKLIQDLSKNQGDVNLDKFESGLEGFVSVRKSYNMLTDKDAEIIASSGVPEKYRGFVSIIGEGEEREITRTINDPLLSTLVNKDGWLTIGDESYSFERDKYFIIKLKDMPKNGRLSTKSLPSIFTIGKVTRGSYNPNARTSASETCINEYWTGWTKKRFAGDMDFETYAQQSSYPGFVFYKNVTCYSKHQKRILGTWWTSSIPTIKLSGSIDIKPDYQPIRTETFDQTENGSGWLQQSYPSGNCDAICTPIYANISTNHSGQCDDWNWRNCQLYK